MAKISRTNITKLKRRTVLRKDIKELIKNVEKHINGYGDRDTENIIL